MRYQISGQQINIGEALQEAICTHHHLMPLTGCAVLCCRKAQPKRTMLGSRAIPV